VVARGGGGGGGAAGGCRRGEGQEARRRERHPARVLGGRSVRGGGRDHGC
jgi:hypothetical protein